MKSGREAERWREVTAEMSDEEKRGDVYVRYRPEYRSERFNSFFDKLDEKCEKKSSHLARWRCVCTPSKTPQPQPLHVISWMVMERATDNTHTEQQAELNESVASGDGSSDVGSTVDSGDDRQ